MLDKVAQNLLDEVAGIRDVPGTAHSIRLDGQSYNIGSTANISVTRKADKPGIDLHIAPGTKAEQVHIPVVITQPGIEETVYNDFYVGEGADVTIVAGCGIHNCGGARSQHDGIHVFHLEQNAKVLYMEKHVGSGDGTGGRVMNPVTEVYMEPGSSFDMDTVQIKGIDSTNRVTKARIADDCTLVIKEKLMTHGNQVANTEYEIELDGKNASTNVVSRSVARDSSKQVFLSKINGNNLCAGHSECDAIIMDHASVRAIPEITANHVEASLIHEAAIGKIAGEQIIKLMTLGLDETQAEQHMIEGFLK